MGVNLSSAVLRSAEPVLFDTGAPIDDVAEVADEIAEAALRSG